MTTIRFLPIKTNKEKVSTLCQTLQNHFNLRQAVVVATPNSEVAHYIDLLLWRNPLDSFLPHVYSEGPCKEKIAIVTGVANPNQAQILFNLCPWVHPDSQKFSLIYELDDQTDPEKAVVSRQKQDAYKASLYTIKLA